MLIVPSIYPHLNSNLNINSSVFSKLTVHNAGNDQGNLPLQTRDIDRRQSYQGWRDHSARIVEHSLWYSCCCLDSEACSRYLQELLFHCQILL